MTLSRKPCDKQLMLTWLINSQRRQHGYSNYLCSMNIVRNCWLEREIEPAESKSLVVSGSFIHQTWLLSSLHTPFIFPVLLLIFCPWDDWLSSTRSKSVLISPKTRWLCDWFLLRPRVQNAVNICHGWWEWYTHSFVLMITNSSTISCHQATKWSLSWYTPFH